MYLKALELQGFKSFPEKTHLTFEKAVTAIVGPNGSGKSNIADAIQWVLGEQSTKAMRGGKMEDVIFGGTEKRGQVGFAEVSLILDNADRELNLEADEIQVTRRYYRSGDSEYYINRKTVRLKDINELFMDTGLGRDGYSIIGQGKIDSILSAKSTDRREIFEEAAGISRYRHRKEESERKLQRAEEDLLRVNDKISELELQVEPLRKQSEVAKRYLILRDELRSLEISLWLTDLDNLAEKSKKLECEAMAAQGNLERARRELEMLYGSGEEFSNKMRKKDMEAEDVRAQVSAHDSEMAEAESQAAVLRANLGHNQENIQRIDEEIKRQEGRDSGIQSQIEERQSRLEQISEEIKALDKALDDIAKESYELSRTESESELRILELRKRLEDNASAVSEARAELSSVATSMQEIDDRGTALIAEINAEEARLNAAREDAEKNRAALNKAEENSDSLRNVVRGYSLRMDSKRKKTEELFDKKTKLEMSLNATHSRRNMLAEMEKEYEGYSRSVKTVMREASRGVLRGIHGPAGELIKTAGKYALAIETAMGAAMQNVIVSSEEDGKAAINLLKRQEAGRVTLLPMSVIKGSRLDANGLDREDGFEGIAFDLVEFDPKYKDIYTNLLGRTAVVDDMDSAVRIARRFSYRFRIVTLDGQVLNAGGSMTGGSSSNNTGILSRANELETLAAKEKTLTAELSEMVRAFEDAKRDQERSDYELKVASDELRMAEAEAAKLGAEKEHFTLLVSSLEDHAAQLREESANIRARTEQLTEKLDRIKSSIASLEKEGDDIRTQQESEDGGRTGLSEKRHALMDAEADTKASRASLEAEKLAQTQSVEELSKLRSELSGGREKQAETLSALRSQNEKIIEDIAEHERAAVRVKLALEGLKKRLSDIAEEKLNIEAERVKRDKETQEKNNELLELERENARVEQRRQAFSMEEKQIIDKLWDNYELSRTTAMEQMIILESIPAAKRRTGELRREMLSLGTPNLGAIDEFLRVNTRYTYLTDQRDDIEKAKTELLSIINDITDSMKGIFSEEFRKINQRFSETFIKLFGGGQASLELEDESDILNSGIEIKVQPPGKTLKTITLLSGGEKAFVAIALYFAIIEVRPTPFVVMDEIEAALDEVNVVRVSSYMRGLSDKTQFLVITHRRGTMEDADVLYGVTMQEQGVSRVLKIDLGEAEKTINKYPKAALRTSMD